MTAPVLDMDWDGQELAPGARGHMATFARTLARPACPAAVQVVLERGARRGPTRPSASATPAPLARRRGRADGRRATAWSSRPSACRARSARAAARAWDADRLLVAPALFRARGPRVGLAALPARCAPTASAAGRSRLVAAGGAPALRQLAPAPHGQPAGSRTPRRSRGRRADRRHPAGRSRRTRSARPPPQGGPAPSPARAAARATATGSPAAIPRWSATIIVDRGFVGHGHQAGHDRLRAGPVERSPSPSSSSPALTAAVPTSQAARTTSLGASCSFSRSNTVSGPSASCRLENIGLSTRNEPWQARWAIVRALQRGQHLVHPGRRSRHRTCGPRDTRSSAPPAPPPPRPAPVRRPGPLSAGQRASGRDTDGLQ